MVYKHFARCHLVLSRVISDGIRSDTSVLLSLVLSALFFGWDLVFSLLDVCVTCALFLYFSCLKKKEKKTF